MPSEQTVAHELPLLNSPILSRARARSVEQRRKLDQLLTEEVSPLYVCFRRREPGGLRFARTR
jgi:hypothetical protein